MPSPKPLLKFSAPSDRALENLEAGQIFCQRHDSYNDPFEFWSEIVTGIPDAVLEPNRFLSALRAWGFHYDTVDEALADQNVTENVTEYFDECTSYAPPFEDMRRGMRIACFASQRDNLLMWSHYADGLRGFCIAFDEEALLSGRNDAHVMDVSYVDRPPLVDSFIYGIAHDQDWFSDVAIHEAQARIKVYGGPEGPGDIEPYETLGAEAIETMRGLWQGVFATKPEAWRYEAERRLLVHADPQDEGPLLWKYDRGAVREIILGERMPAACRGRLLAVAAEFYPDVPVRTARRSRGSYAVQID